MPTVASNITSLDARRRPAVRVERKASASRPNCTEYRLYGSRSQDVQDYISSLVAELEQHGANFGSSWRGPHSIGHGCYAAFGEIVLIQPEPL
jgi:hypothetical protein